LIRSALAVLCIVAGAAQASADNVRTVSVSGQCLRTALPDRGSITVVPEFQDKDISVVTKKTTDSYEAVKKAVVALKLKNLEISTSEYSVSAMNDYVKGKTVPRGFRARMGLLVTTSETARLGEVIAIAAKNNVQDVGALYSFLSDETSRSEHEACLEEAIQHASAKAARMAKAAGAKLGKVQSLQEEGSSLPPPPRPMMMAREAMSEDAPLGSVAPSVDTSAQKIQLSVNAVYSLE
jgi:uncharacterized protein YggE